MEGKDQLPKNQKDGFELLYKANNIEISFNPVTKIMYTDWIGIQHEDALKHSGQRILDLVKEKKCSQILNDNTRVIGPWYHSVDWASDQWFPRIIAAGVKQFAWICSDDVLTQLSGRRAIPEGNDVVRAFPTYDEALEWLLSC